jgi:mRNA-degrading endonuclease RelE of RelBE toxin-antitoxin system
MDSDSRRFTIEYAPITKEHLRSIDRKHHSSIRDTIADQLAFEPIDETRNRRPLKRPVVFMATWEVRFGTQNQFRVYYSVDLEQRTVSILAIGFKDRNRIVIGGEEFHL